MPIDEMPKLPVALAGIPIERLIGWSREPALASPEIREALRTPEVLAFLRAYASRVRFDRAVIA